MAVSNGYSCCLLCLGEGHVVETCTHCSRFTRQTKRNRAARLHHLLTLKALNMEPPTSPPPQETLKTASVVSTPKSVKTLVSAKSPTQSTSRGASKSTNASRTTEAHKEKKALKKDKTNCKKEKTTEMTLLAVLSNTLSTTDVVNPGLMQPAQILETPERRRQSPDASSLQTAQGTKQMQSVPLKERALAEHPSRPVMLSSESEEDQDVLPPKRRRTRSRSPSFASRLSQTDYEYYYRPIGMGRRVSPEFWDREPFYKEPYDYRRSSYDPRYRRSPSEHFFSEFHERERGRPFSPSRYRRNQWPPTRPVQDVRQHHHNRSSPPHIFRDRSPSPLQFRERPHRDRMPPTHTIVRPPSVSLRHKESEEQRNRPLPWLLHKLNWYRVLL